MSKSIQFLERELKKTERRARVIIKQQEDAELVWDGKCGICKFGGKGFFGLVAYYFSVLPLGNLLR